MPQKRVLAALSVRFPSGRLADRRIRISDTSRSGPRSAPTVSLLRRVALCRNAVCDAPAQIRPRRVVVAAINDALQLARLFLRLGARLENHQRCERNTDPNPPKPA